MRFGLNKAACDACGGSFGLARKQVGSKQFCGQKCVASNQNGSVATITTSPLRKTGEVVMELRDAAD
ncbi:hypothetical protein K2Q08_02135 [Patescibacteria group bacterium]|nr:hypothetical protein [Patescibacteria group bacterium]